MEITRPRSEGTGNSVVTEAAVRELVLFVCFSAVSNKSDLPRIHQLHAVALTLRYKSPCSSNRNLFLVCPASCT